jgi:drug/metabolite transporter (DMT)-like permease
MTNQKKAYFFAIPAILFWSTMSSAFKLTLNHIEFDHMLLWSSVFGAFFLIIIHLFKCKSIKISDSYKRDIASSALMGFFNPFLYYLLLFKAYDLLEAQIAGTLNYIWPIVLVLMSVIFLKQKIGLLSFVAIFISFTGITIISTRGSFTELGDSSPLGILLAVISSVFWATYWILNLKDKREETGKIALNLLIGSLYIVIYMLVTSDGISFPEGYALVGCIYIGLFEMSVTFVIWLLALKNSINTAKVSNLIYLSPFIALIFIRFTVNESIHVYTIIGLLFIVGGILIQQFNKSDAKS